jgi:SAM-dependent methyltransferase
MADEIDETTWYQQTSTRLTSAYLAGENPRAQSGFTGDQVHWTQARSLIAEAVDRDGAFLDIGCAIGFLLECLVDWVLQKGHRVEPYGLDISVGLVDLARKRLPHWADRFFVGNAIDWEPPQRYDFVRTGLEYVPEKRRADLIRRLLATVVRPGGRLIIGTFNEGKAAGEDPSGWPSTEETVTAWGFEVSGRAERPHFRDPQLVYRVLWIDC